MSDGNSNLFERLGGAGSLAKMIDEVYHRVLADPQLAEYFEGVPMDRLRKMQYHFLACAFDGPVEYAGSELTAAHANRGIGAKQFGKFCGHFADVLEDNHVDPRDINQALGRLATFKDKVTGDANVDG